MSAKPTSPPEPGLPPPIRLGWAALLAISAGTCALLLIIFSDHLSAMDLSRGTAYRTTARLVEGRPAYPPPSASFVPLAHNPLFYRLSAALVPLVGDVPQATRLAAIAGALGAWLAVAASVFQRTRSRRFALFASGLFAGAYLAFDGYLDHATPDSWLLFCGLAGFLVLDARPGRVFGLVAVAMLCAGFWFKQHGALLAIAGVLYLTYRDGLRSSLPAWILAILAGPVAYLALGPLLFGDHFHFYTWEVPAAWGRVDAAAVKRFARYLARHWLYLAHVAVAAFVLTLTRRRRLGAWSFGLPFALLVGLAASLDPGSEDNVFAITGTWLIVVGVSALWELRSPGRRATSVETTRRALVARDLLALFLLSGSFALNAFDPRRVLTPPDATAARARLAMLVQSLDGPVYLPEVSWISGDDLATPLHWVPLDDLLRDDAREEETRRIVRDLMRQLHHEDQPTYLLTAYPLDSPNYAYLEPHVAPYALSRDLGEAFAGLRRVPGRFGSTTYPRYLYRRDAPDLSREAP